MMIPRARLQAKICGHIRNLEDIIPVIPHLFPSVSCKCRGFKTVYTSTKHPNHASTRSVRTISLRLVRPALRNSGSEVLEYINCALPVDAGIGDGDALLEAAGTLGRDLLVALVDVGLDHDADDAGLAVADLVCDVLCDLGLVAVVLVGVTWAR